jgi:hypothetical protein
MNIDLVRAILAGEVPVYNLSVAFDPDDLPEGWAYWEQRARDGLDAEARAKLQALVDGR